VDSFSLSLFLSNQPAARAPAFCLLSISLSNCFPPFFPVVNPACSCHDWYLQQAQKETEKGGKGVQNSINQRTVEGGKGGLRTRAEHCLRKPHTIKTHEHHTHTHIQNYRSFAHARPGVGLAFSDGGICTVIVHFPLWGTGRRRRRPGQITSCFAAFYSSISVGLWRGGV